MTPEERLREVFFANDEMCGFLRGDWFVATLAPVIRAAIREELKALRSVFDQREPVDLDDEFANGWDDAAEFAQTQIDRRIRELEEK